jgi:probable DNA metabolism protein
MPAMEIPKLRDGARRKTEITCDGSIEELFDILGKVCGGEPLPDRIRRKPGYALYGAPQPPEQPDLFGGAEKEDENRCRGAEKSPENTTLSRPRAALIKREFFEISAKAYDDFVYAWMSEFPIEREIISFARKVIFAARKAGGKSGVSSFESRFAAEKAASDRGDPEVCTVLNAAFKTGREVERLKGLLRFSPAARGIHIARCGPDHFALPALAGHFTRRFGGLPWAIIDEKRRLVLTRLEGEEASILPFDPCHPWFAETPAAPDAWENLWTNYHRSVNNESRNNPALQRQFMPARYWKYLPEISPKD